MGFKDLVVFNKVVFGVLKKGIVHTGNGKVFLREEKYLLQIVGRWEMEQKLEVGGIDGCLKDALIDQPILTILDL